MIRSRENTRDKRALVTGFFLLIFIGVYFIGRNLLRKDLISSVDTKNQVTTDNTTKNDVPSITPDVLWKKIQNGDKIKIIDIRTEIAFGDAHIAHSISMPISSLPNLSLDKDEMAVIVLSESNLESVETAKNILKQKSFPYFFLKGGIEAWGSSGAPTLSNGDPNSFLNQSKVTYITLEAFKKIRNENPSSVFLLDVQTEGSYQRKHLAGAVNIPLSELEKRQKEIPTGRIVIVYGENDITSFQGSVRLFDLGISTAQTLTGNKYLSSDSGLIFEP